MDIFITNIITEYDQKAEKYCEPKSHNKGKILRSENETKIGDQRDIVQFMIEEGLLDN